VKARLDFATLTLRGALDFAVTIEEDAEERYREFARQVADPAVAAFFREMVVSEGKHRRQLESRRAVLFRHQPRRFERLADAEGEAPPPDEVPATTSARQAIGLALRAEVRAWDFYDQAIPHVRDPDVRAFFEELRAEEVEHQQLLNDLLAKLPP
jgi:erythrin-vacuolar iron transport family protein